MHSQEYVIVGRFGGPYGVHGWIRVTSFTDPPANLLLYGPWHVERDGQWHAYHPVQVRPHQQGLIACYADIPDRSVAAALTGRFIAVPRDCLPVLDAEEYYWRDLEGLEVWNRGARLGVVDHLIDTGANSVLAVRGDSTQTLIPFVSRFVTGVDLAAGRIDVDWEEVD
ncbi:MAG TPA: ribosome maturation factor RimM [Pseudomonadales bacterium]|jgi:16S rRNA processing protein RimM